MAAIQFIGPFQFLQAMVKAMVHGGSIIEISSVTATIMMDNHAAYMGTKAGMDHVIRCVAHEFGAQGIRANSISPGGTADTPMSHGGLNFEPIANLYKREIPLQRPGIAEDIANAALWLASDESSFVTGQKSASERRADFAPQSFDSGDLRGHGRCAGDCVMSSLPEERGDPG
ncbi:SDR family oxidoreductase [Undibacterium arcticum]